MVIRRRCKPPKYDADLIYDYSVRPIPFTDWLKVSTLWLTVSQVSKDLSKIEDLEAKALIQPIYSQKKKLEKLCITNLNLIILQQKKTKSYNLPFITTILNSKPWSHLKKQ